MRYHLLSLSKLPKLVATYVYSVDPEGVAWTQEKDWLFLMTTYAGVLTLGARSYAFEPWSVFLVPPGQRCRLEACNQPDATAYWIRIQPERSGAPMVAIPHVGRLGSDGEFWSRRLRSSFTRAYQMGGETQVVVADMLWFLAEDPGSVRQSEALEAAERFVEEHIGEPLRIEQLAQAVGISHNQLIRLFRQEHALTPQEYVRLRKQHHACRLLIETDWPVKRVAAEVGIGDLAQFNRLVRASAGMSPRELRGARRPAPLLRNVR